LLELFKCFNILHKDEKRINGDRSLKTNDLLNYLLCIDQEEKERQEH
jgi:hypothetical protein